MTDSSEEGEQLDAIVEQTRENVRSSFNAALADLRDPPDDATPSQLAMAGMAQILSMPAMQQMLAEANEHDDALRSFAAMLLSMRGGKHVSIIIDLPRNPTQGLPAGTILRKVEQAYRAALEGPPTLEID